MISSLETPLILGGGGITGLCRLAGVFLALEREGITYTSIHGTSAGAIAGAMLAAGHSPVKIANIINSLTDADLRDKVFLWQLRMYWLDSIFKTDKIWALLNNLLPASFNDLKIPISSWAVNMESEALVNTMRPELSETPTEAVLASMSIPCIFPPVKLLDGQSYGDGGLRASVPVFIDMATCEKVYIVIPSDRPHDYQGKDNMLTAAIRAMNILRNDEKLDLIDQFKDQDKVVVLWPDVPTDLGMMHVDHSLVKKTYDWTLTELNKRKGTCGNVTLSKGVCK